LQPAQAPAITADDRTRLIAAATAAVQQAYAPYSSFLVGAALLTERGNVFSGCNVENASYGLTICAERNAIFAAVAGEGPTLRIRAIAVTNKAGVACSPCGACRQVIFEFGPDAVIFYRGSKDMQSSTASELLPAGFRLE
jgi:cytidine deaminase